ncbi:NERD domain-containing protein, partial [Pseudomonadota bacterium]
MTVEIYQEKDYETAHERYAAERIITSLKEKFEHSNDLVVVLVDYNIRGKDVDLTILKNDAILIVELKEESEPFTATLNQWSTISGRNVGLSGSPYSQVRRYRNLWRDELKQNGRNIRCLRGLHSTDFNRATWHTKGVVAISPRLPDGVINQISRADAPWFQLCGEDELTRAVELATTPFYNFRNTELRSIATKWLNLDGPFDGFTVRTGIKPETATKEDFENLKTLIENLVRQTEESNTSGDGEDDLKTTNKIDRIEGLIEELGTKTVTTEHMDAIFDLIAESQPKSDEKAKKKNGTDEPKISEDLNNITRLLEELISKTVSQATPGAKGAVPKGSDTSEDDDSDDNLGGERKSRRLLMFGTALVITAVLALLYFLLN